VIRSLRFLLVFAAVFACVLPAAEAHELRPGYLEISTLADAEYKVVWKAPIRLGRPISVEPSFPADCAITGEVSRTQGAAALVSVFALTCASPLDGQAVVLRGLDSTLTDVLVRFQPASGREQTGRVTPDNPAITLSSTSTGWGVAQTYFKLGVEHILGGIDHLLFVFALVLLITGTRRLIETITAFTLAHSVTLIATSLGWVSLPPASVEAVIALSIVFLAREIVLMQPGQERLSERRPWLVALAFGLLHGFGFAGALSAIGLPEDSVPLALLTFNLGVEAGQILFVAVVLVLLALVRRLATSIRIEALASYGIGIAASVWLIERLISR